jgi:hypothetical protein
MLAALARRRIGPSIWWLGYDLDGGRRTGGEERDMIRLVGPSFGFIVVMALWIYALLDLIQTDEILVRNLPKMMWLLLVIFIPMVGSLAWIIAGRPLYAGWAPGGSQAQRPRARLAPEDRPDWSIAAPPPSSGPTAADLQRWEDDLARRERELGEQGEPEDPPELGPGPTA